MMSALKTNMLTTIRLIAFGLVGLCGVVFSACHDHIADDVPTPLTALSFSASLDENLSYTRASTSTPMQDVYKSFKVWAVKFNGDPVTPFTSIDGYKVEYKESKPADGGETWGDGESEVDGASYWSYDHVEGQSMKYWDPSAEKYIFSGVAPWFDENNHNGADTIEAVLENGELKIKKIAGNIPSSGDENCIKDCDWVVARTERGQDDFTKDVPLTFQHIFAKVDFKVYSNEGTLVLKEFKVEIPDGSEDEIINVGEFSLALIDWKMTGWSNTKANTNKTINQDPTLFDKYTYNPTKTVTAGRDNAVLVASHVQIPQTFPTAGRVFSITCKATGADSEEKTLTGTITLDTSNGHKIGETTTTGWEQNKHYTYILLLDLEGSNDIILSSVEMEDWKHPSTTNEKEETQTNW